MKASPNWSCIRTGY